MKVSDLVLELPPYFCALDETYEEDAETYIRRAESEGYKVLYPGPNQIFIDIDTEEQWVNLKHMWGILLSKTNATNTISVSSGGLPGKHVIITLPFETSQIEKIALQAALGSDPMKELLSFFRHYRKEATPTLFVEKGE